VPFVLAPSCRSLPNNNIQKYECRGGTRLLNGRFNAKKVNWPFSSACSSLLIVLIHSGAMMGISDIDCEAGEIIDQMEFLELVRVLIEPNPGCITG
jgi:hypothetical protein